VTAAHGVNGAPDWLWESWVDQQRYQGWRRGRGQCDHCALVAAGCAGAVKDRDICALRDLALCESNIVRACVPYRWSIALIHPDSMPAPPASIRCSCTHVATNPLHQHNLNNTPQPQPPAPKPSRSTLGPAATSIPGAGGIFKSAAVEVLRMERRLMTTGEITK